MGRDSLVWCVVVTLNLAMLFVQLGMGPSRSFLDPQNLNQNNHLNLNLNLNNPNDDNLNSCDRVRAGHRLYCVFMSQLHNSNSNSPATSPRLQHRQQRHLAIIQDFEAWVARWLFPHRQEEEDMLASLLQL